MDKNILEGSGKQLEGTAQLVALAPFRFRTTGANARR